MTKREKNLIERASRKKAHRVVLTREHREHGAGSSYGEMLEDGFNATRYDDE